MSQRSLTKPVYVFYDVSLGHNSCINTTACLQRRSQRCHGAPLRDRVALFCLGQLLSEGSFLMCKVHKDPCTMGKLV